MVSQPRRHFQYEPCVSGLAPLYLFWVVDNQGRIFQPRMNTNSHEWDDNPRPTTGYHSWLFVFIRG
jgi:hypothetical protein